MASLNVEELSPFGRAALKLDGEFSELNRLSGQIQRLEIESDHGLDRAVKLLNQFTQHGQNIADGIQEFAKSLLAAREESEKAAKIVSERAQLVQQRKQEQDRMQQRLGLLGQKVKQVSQTLSSLRKPPEEGYSNEERLQMPARLMELNAHLTGFMEEAQAIKAEANRSNLKGIERSAQSLFGTLDSARRKLSAVMPTTP